jgi:hypothetical protein
MKFKSQLVLSILIAINILTSCRNETRMNNKIDGEWNIEIYDRFTYKNGNLVETYNYNNAGTLVFDYVGADISPTQNTGTFQVLPKAGILAFEEIRVDGNSGLSGSFSWYTRDTEDRLIMEKQSGFLGGWYTLVFTMEKLSRRKIVLYYDLASSDDEGNLNTIHERFELKKN